MATIKEISEVTGLSIATVSKVLNGKAGVNAETRKKVLRVAEKLRYRPNLNARNLKAGCSRTIGIITEDLTVFNSPEIVDGIAEACDAAGYHYILSNLRFYKRYGNGQRDLRESEALIHSVIDDMVSKQVDGIIYIGCHSHFVVSLAGHNAPRFVCAYCISKDEGVPSVVYNEEKASYDLTCRLLDAGCKKPAMITGPSDSSHTINRSRGYMKALYDRGIPYDPFLTLTGDWERDCGYELGRQLIRSGADAIFAQNDLMAVGVLDYCNASGIVVGKDVKLIGFDNREIASVSRPTLSSVSLPLFEIGQTAAAEMLSILAGKEASGETIMLDCEIIERESTLGSL